MSRDYTEITDEQLRTINKRAIEQPSYDALREQNRVLREALQEIYEGRWTPGVSCCYEDDARDIYPTREMRIRNIAMAALTATSQEGQHG
jgi:ribosomal protein S3AE